MTRLQQSPAQTAVKTPGTQDLSVVIVSYNSREMLGKCLKAAMNASRGLGVEFLVVDNHSEDGSSDLVAEQFPRVRLMQNAENRGFAAACNQGIRESRGRIILLLNPDAFLRKRPLADMLEFMQRHPKAGVCGARLIEEDGELQPPFVHFPTPLSSLFSETRLGRLFPRSHHLIRPEVVARSLRGPIRVDWVSGACFMVRKKAIDEVGLMDEGYFLYFEETDWCRRMATRGWQVWFIPHARVSHLGGRSLDEKASSGPFESYHAEHMLKSRRRHMRKYYGQWGMLVTEVVDLGLYSILFLKNRFRRGRAARAKVANAIAAIAFILGLRKVCIVSVANRAA